MENDLVSEAARILHPQVNAWIKEQGDDEPVAVHVVAAVESGAVETPEALAAMIYGFYVDALEAKESKNVFEPPRDSPSGAPGLGVDLGMLIGAGLVLLVIRHVEDDLVAVAKLLDKSGSGMPGAAGILQILQSLAPSFSSGGTPWPPTPPPPEAWGFPEEEAPEVPEASDEPEEPSEA